MQEALLLKVILGPIAVGLFFLVLHEWREIRSLHSQRDSLAAKVTELEKVKPDASRGRAETSAQKDAEIQRQAKQIEDLHKEMLRITKLYSTGKGVLIPNSILRQEDQKRTSHDA
jgi:hypothetical protein